MLGVIQKCMITKKKAVLKPDPNLNVTIGAKTNRTKIYKSERTNSYELAKN